MKKEVELTQKALVGRLHKLGYRDVTDRRITDWKNKGLLPPFDRGGAGLGKGKGKAESTWTNGRAIVGRAVWVHRLMSIYRNAESLHLPLWMVGYEVETELVRAALLEPLEGVAEMFETEAIDKLEIVEPLERKDGMIEDYIGDLAEDWVRKEKFAELLGIPQEVVETAMNIFFNPDYDLGDLGFEDGNRQLKVWKNRVNNEIFPVLTNGFEESKNDPKPIHPEGIELVFSQPGFFQERLSIKALRNAVADASEAEFQSVQEDLQVLRTVVEPMGEVIATLMKHARIQKLPTLFDVLPDLFRVANLLVLVDLSMRRHGLGPQIDHARTGATKKFQEDFSQVTEQELAKIGPELGDAFKKGFKKLKKNLRILLSARAKITLAS